MDWLTTSGIRSVVDSYIQNERQKLVAPVNTKRTQFQNIITTYNTLISRVESLKSLFTNLKSSASSSVFNQKNPVSSNNNLLSVTADNTAPNGTFQVNIKQLAKNDSAVSKQISSDLFSGLSGVHNFSIKTGDGSGGFFTSNIGVNLEGTETNRELIIKLRDAVNSNKAGVLSVPKDPEEIYNGGESTFKININGTIKSITVNGGGTYSDLFDEINAKIKELVPGVSAEKIVTENSLSLNISVKDSSKYISVSHESGFDLVGDLGFSTERIKAASSVLNVSLVNPVTGISQLSFMSKETGLDYRIREMSDSSSSGILNYLGMNHGTERPQYSSAAGSEGGFIYSVTGSDNQLNSRFIFNGIEIQRNSNLVKDLLQGVTLNLKGITPPGESDINISVAPDYEAIKGKVEEFVTKFNELFSFIKAQSIRSQKGTLAGDSNASGIITILSETARLKSGEGGTGEITLQNLGITFNSNSGLSLSDPAKLTQFLNGDLEGASQLFNSDNGIINSFLNKIASYTGSTGSLTSSIKKYQDNINQLNDRKTVLEKRIDKSAEILRKRYEKLQAQLAALLTTQSMFSSSGLS
jgi:flagellar hook-associated protein 2